MILFAFFMIVIFFIFYFESARFLCLLIFLYMLALTRAINKWVNVLL